MLCGAPEIGHEGICVTMAHAVIGLQECDHFHMRELNLGFKNHEPVCDGMAVFSFNGGKVALRPTNFLAHQHTNTTVQK